MIRATKYWGPFKQRWYSICSMHMDQYDPYCNMCTSGTWHNCWGTWISAKVYKYAPKFWRWWVNL